MKETTPSHIDSLFEKQKIFFAGGKTKEINFRISQLRKLKEAIFQNEEKLKEALWNDLRKSPEEAYLTEISLLLNEIDYHIKNLKKWAKPRKIRTPLPLWPSSSRIVYEPLGVSLIIAPWNYPLLLMFGPLVGSISAGGTAILKPSPDAVHSAMIMQEIIEKTFPDEYIALIQGDVETTAYLTNKKFDLIFFTGSPRVGKIIMKAAAENLTPVVLELGGKSPCIVDRDADIKTAAKRIAWGKWINAGQTCIAPDYLLVHRSVKQKLLDEIINNIKKMYGDDIRKSRFYPRIIHQKAMKRLLALMKDAQIFWGGDFIEEEKFISPTIITQVKPDDKIMQEEIFGPLLPVLEFHEIDEALNYINSNEKPLALYYFGKTKKADEILAKTSSGGACINDTLIHFANHWLPFGGVGTSGMGKYHGKYSFRAFSNARSVVSSSVRIDIPMKYVPFKNFSLTRKLLRLP